MEVITISSDLPPAVAPKTPIPLPIFGYGTSPIGDLFVNTPEVEIQKALDKAWELGVRYYDTAPWYGHGLSEHRLGSLLRQHDRKKKKTLKSTFLKVKSDCSNIRTLI